MGLWDKIRGDIQKGYKEGLAAIKEGSIVVKKKAGELAEEGRKQIKLFELKQKVQGRFTDLGGRIYDLVRSNKDNLLEDKKIKSTVNAINKLEDQITRIEKKPSKAAGKKKPATRKTSTGTKRRSPKKKVAQAEKTEQAQ